MKTFFLTLLLAFTCISLTHADDSKPPRQKIELLGLTLSGKNEKISVENLEKEFKTVESYVYDPYNKNKKTKFTGIYFTDFVKKYGKPESTKVLVKAIDGYSVETPLKLMETEKIIIAFKDESGYLSVKRMGPIRVIYPINTLISKENLLRIGLHWVWQVKSIEFKK